MSVGQDFSPEVETKNKMYQKTKSAAKLVTNFSLSTRRIKSLQHFS